MSIFEHQDYKAFVSQRISTMPKNGHGEYQKISKALKMHSTRVSHIFRGPMHLTIEQAAGLCRHWGMDQLESEYFLLLVQIARAGTNDARKILQTQANHMREKSKDLRHRVPRERELTESEKAIFYSSWYYSAARLLSSIDSYQSIDAIAEKLDQPREKVRGIMDFLVQTGLCVMKDGKYQMGPKTTHLEASSPLIQRHHSNWRLRALSRHERISERELAYTCPVSINRADQERLRELLVLTIQSFLKTVTTSEPAEMVACFTLDWIEV